MLRSVYISSVCNAHASLLFFFFCNGGAHTHTHPNTHRRGRLQQPSALETQQGKEAESRNGEVDRRREVSQSARSLHCCCQNAILFNKLGKIGDFSLAQSVRELPQLSGSNRLCLSFSQPLGKDLGRPISPLTAPQDVCDNDTCLTGLDCKGLGVVGVRLNSYMKPCFWATSVWRLNLQSFTKLGAWHCDCNSFGCDSGNSSHLGFGGNGKNWRFGSWQRAKSELKFIGFFTSIHWEDFTSCWGCNAYHFLIISGQTVIFSYTEPRSCLAQIQTNTFNA